LKVFHNNKKCTTSYCKVYSDGAKGQKFYRDGYTDVASNFRYALSLDGITEFSILVLTDYGGIIQRVKPPTVWLSSKNYYQIYLKSNNNIYFLIYYKILTYKIMVIQ